MKNSCVLCGSTKADPCSGCNNEIYVCEKCQPEHICTTRGEKKATTKIVGYRWFEYKTGALSVNVYASKELCERAITWRKSHDVRFRNTEFSMQEITTDGENFFSTEQYGGDTFTFKLDPFGKLPDPQAIRKKFTAKDRGRKAVGYRWNGDDGATGIRLYATLKACEDAIAERKASAPELKAVEHGVEEIQTNGFMLYGASKENKFIKLIDLDSHLEYATDLPKSKAAARK